MKKSNKTTLKQMKQVLIDNGFDIKGLDKEDIRQEYELLMTQLLADEIAATTEEPEVTVVSVEVTPAQEPVVAEVTPVAPIETEVAQEVSAPPVPPTEEVTVVSATVNPVPVQPETPVTPAPQTPVVEQPVTEQKPKIRPPKCLEDVLEYIIWKQLNAEALRTKEYVNAGVLDDYCKQKIYGRSAVDFNTKQPNSFTEEELVNVQKTIAALMDNGYVTSVSYKNRFGQEVNGYTINPWCISNYCYKGYFPKGSKERVYSDMVYLHKGVEYQVDYKSGYCANRKTGKLTKMETSHWSQFYKYGKFVGLVNRKTNVYVAFAKPEKETEPVAAPTMPTAPVVPQQ